MLPSVIAANSPKSLPPQRPIEQWGYAAIVVNVQMRLRRLSSAGALHDMDGLTGLHGGDLLDQADKEDLCAVRLHPIGPSARAPALLAGSLIGNGDGGGERILRLPYS